MSRWWAGSYGRDLDGTSRGIAILDSRSDGSLQYRELVVETDSPSYLVEGNGHVYAANEAHELVTAFRRDSDSLVAVSTSHSGGAFPCHLALIDGALVVANYGSGTVGLVEVRPDGSVGGLREILDSPHGAGHAHASLLLEGGMLLTADLGADLVLVHEVAAQRVTRTGEVPLTSGTGPRDLALHASSLVYVLGELDGTVSVLQTSDGMPRVVASVGLPGFVAGDHAAAISFGPGGYLYAGLRGSNRISVLHAESDGVNLTGVGWVSCEGDWPRHLTVDGDVLHVANQKSNTAASFRVDGDGIPRLIREPEGIASPTFLLKAL